MKRTCAKQGMMTLVAGFFLLGFMLFTGNRAEAQSYNWMQSDQAQQVLVTKVTDLQSSLQGMTPGTQNYNEALIRAYYYKAIYRDIAGGASVEQSVSSGLKIFSPAPNAPSIKTNEVVTDVAVDKPKQQVLLSEATGLLTL